MGGSTITVQNILDRVAAKGIPIPLAMPAGYGTDLAVAMANDVMADIITERFNWKFNRIVARPFLTNTFQQDYPQYFLNNVGWIEDADRIDINNTALPPPLRNLTVRRQLSRTNLAWTPVNEICWNYNNQLSYGTWPGPGVTFYPQITNLVKQNPMMSMIDANGNLLILLEVGTTGTQPPVVPVNTAEGETITDGTAIWAVVAPTSQGWRVSPMPPAAGPVWQIIPYYQARPPVITVIGQTIDPIPDDYSRYFQQGMEAYCLQASPNPADKQRFEPAYAKWIAGMENAKKQGDKEVDAYALLPATVPVENIYSWIRNPMDPSQPY